MMVAAASQGVSHAAHHCAGWCLSAAEIQGKTWYFRDKALWGTSLPQRKPALMDSGAAADPGPGVPVPNHPLSPTHLR